MWSVYVCMYVCIYVCVCVGRVGGCCVCPLARFVRPLDIRTQTIATHFHLQTEHKIMHACFINNLNRK